MSFAFSQHSLEQLATLHPDLKIICSYAISRHDFKVLEGHRDQAAQDKAFAEGKSKLKWPQSKHNSNPSMAMDLLPFVNGKFIGWEDAKQWQYFGGLVIGWADALYTMGEIGHRLRWGHDFNGNNDLDDQRFVDAPHFELINPT